MKFLPVPEQPEKEKMFDWLKRASNGLCARLFFTNKNFDREDDAKGGELRSPTQRVFVSTDLVSSQISIRQ